MANKGCVVEFYTSQSLPDGSATLRVTSPYGWRTHPITGARSFHSGTDFGGGWRWRDYPVRTPASGTVVLVDYHNSYGKRVILRMDKDPDKNQLLFAHLNSISVQVGDRLSRGDIIGGMGTTGNSTGEHLHFEIRKPPRNSNALPQQSDIWGNPADFDFSREVVSLRKVHVVTRGDTLSRIAQMYGIPNWQTLRDWNVERYPSLKNSTVIHVGWELYVEPDWKLLAQQLEKDLDNCKKVKKDLQKDIKQYKNEVDKINSLLSEYITKVEKLNEQLKDAEQSKLKVELLKIEIDKLNNKIIELTDNLNHSLERLELSNNIIKSLELKIDKKVGQIDLLKSELKLKNNTITELEKELEEFRKYIKIEYDWSKFIKLMKEFILKLFGKGVR